MSDGAPTPRAPGPEHFPGPLASLALTFGSALAVVFATRVVMGVFDARPTLTSLGVGEAIGVGAVATFAARRVAEPHRERLGLRGFDPSFLPWLLMLIPIVVVLAELDNLVAALLPQREIPEEIAELQRTFLGRGGLALFENAVVAVGIAPVVEEWLFRGVIQQGLVAHLGRARGVILTAGLYAVVHVGPAPSARASLSPFFYSFVLGLVLGTVRLATGSVLAPILVGAGVSAAGLLVLGGAAGFPVPGLNAPGHTSLALLLPCTGGVVWAMHSLVEKARRVPVAIPLPDTRPVREASDEDGL